jgi:inorganic pyrophosphatase
LKLDKATGLYKVDRVLPKGQRFPFNFGFVPQTKAADGDPTDVLLAIDEILFPGCCLDCRLLGVVRAEQTEKSETSFRSKILTHPRTSMIWSDILSEMSKDSLPVIMRPKEIASKF